VEAQGNSLRLHKLYYKLLVLNIKQHESILIYFALMSNTDNFLSYNTCFIRVH
jgi:hypothetical protein